MNIQPVYVSPATVKLNGMNLAVVNESELSYKSFSGGEIGGTFEGPDSIIQPLVQQFILKGYQVRYKRSKSPISTISFSAAFSSSTAGGSASNPNVDYTDSFEIIRNTVQKELLESDHPLVAQLGRNFQIIKDLINGTGTIKFTTNIDTFVGEDTDADYFAACYLWALFQSGVKTFPVKQPILRVTRTTSPLYDAPIYVGNVDTILTTASMLTDSGVPTDYAISMVGLAARLAAKAGDTVTRMARQGIDLKFGWYKDLVSSNKHGNQRSQYVTQYEFGLYDSQLYGNPW